MTRTGRTPRAGTSRTGDAGSAPRFTFHPATPDRWRDLERLFGARGACAGCWCMYMRLPKAEWETGRGERNKQALAALVSAGGEPGLIAYAGDEPVAWCAVRPREEYVRLERSRTLKPVDETPVWSIACFFVAARWRRQGLTVRLLEAAARHARERGAVVLEGYPVVPRKGAMPAAFAWTGLLASFERAGFTEVAQPSPSRRIVRKRLR